MYRLRLLLNGGHFVDATMSPDLADTYDADPEVFGDAVRKALADHPLYIVDSPADGGHGYVRSECVAGWQVLLNP